MLLKKNLWNKYVDHSTESYHNSNPYPTQLQKEVVVSLAPRHDQNKRVEARTTLTTKQRLFQLTIPQNNTLFMF